MTREEAIEVLKDIYNYTRFDTYTTNEARTMAIKALEQTRWIPVSERLPKDGQKVLTTTLDGDLIGTDTSIFYHASAFWKHYVIA